MTIDGLTFSKWGERGLTLREERAETRRERKAHEDQIERAVKARDRNRCRVPGCRERGEWAHLNHRGMGGNPKGDKSTTAETLCLCRPHHREGPDSLDQGGMEVIPLTKAGCDGPLAFHWIRTGRTVKEVTR
jgi:hypothetical protein